MDVKHLRELIAVAKEEGLKSLSFNGIKFELGHAQAAVNHPAGQLEALKSDIEMPTEDEMLLWSTGYYDALKEQRKDALLPPDKVPVDGH